MDVSTSFPCEPKKLVLNVEGLAVSAMAGVGYGVDAVGKGLRVVIIDSGGRWNSIAGHKKDLYHR